jgi:hypothetical protein
VDLRRDPVLVEDLLDVLGRRALAGAGVEPDQRLLTAHRLVFNGLPVRLRGAAARAERDREPHGGPATLRPSRAS